MSFHRCEGVEMARTHSQVKWVVYKTYTQRDPNFEFKMSRYLFSTLGKDRKGI